MLTRRSLFGLALLPVAIAPARSFLKQGHVLADPPILDEILDVPHQWIRRSSVVYLDTLPQSTRPSSSQQSTSMATTPK